MRLYAVLLGIALTTGYGYAAQVAVASVDPGRRAEVDPASMIWYGGSLDPITVESGKPETPPRQGA